MKRVTLLVLLLSLLAVPFALARWNPGENLLLRFVPSKEEWSAYTRHVGESNTTLLQRKGHRYIDSFVISMTSGREEKLPTYREAEDASSKESCGTFESVVLDESPTNSYSRLTWRTRCGLKDGTVVTILRVSIQGRDSFYEVQKLWGVEVSEQEMALWRERLSSISVCDTRDSARPCPEGFEPVQ